MVELRVVVFRAGLLGGIVAGIWKLMGDDIVMDAMGVKDTGQYMDLTDIEKLKVYPLWIQVFLGLLGLYLTLVVLVLLYMILKQIVWRYR